MEPKEFLVRIDCTNKMYNEYVSGRISGIKFAICGGDTRAIETRVTRDENGGAHKTTETHFGKGTYDLYWQVRYLIENQYPGLCEFEFGEFEMDIEK